VNWRRGLSLVLEASKYQLIYPTYAVAVFFSLLLASHSGAEGGAVMDVATEPDKLANVEEFRARARGQMFSLLQVSFFVELFASDLGLVRRV
jgi:hypothetical protein